MSNYTKANVREDVENQAPNFEMPDELDARPDAIASAKKLRPLGDRWKDARAELDEARPELSDPLRPQA